MVDANTEGEVYTAPRPTCRRTGCFYPPTLITGLSPAAPLMQEEIFGPVLVSGTFRTPAEAVQLANNTRYGLAATVWTENLNLALDIAPKLAAGVVWVNATNLFDAAAPFGGMRESGFGREGGWEGMQAYLKPDIALKPAKPVDPAPQPETVDAPGLDRTAKMYVGGKQARPDGGYSQPSIPNAARFWAMPGSAIARTSATRWRPRAARSGWSKATGHLRAQILYYIAENLSARADEFASRIRNLTGTTAAKAEAEVAPPSTGSSPTRLGRQVRRRGEIRADPGRGAGHARTGGRNRPAGAGRRTALARSPCWRPPSRWATAWCWCRPGPHRWRPPTSTRCSTPQTCRAAW
jgi:aldehyde dehydrogenase (NAD+)